MRYMTADNYDLAMDPEGQPDRLVRLAVGLVNLVADGARPVEAADLEGFLVDQGERPPIHLEQRDAAAIAHVREQLAAVFDAADLDTAAGHVNRLLAHAQTPPVLSNHDGSRWHLHLTGDDAPWADWLAAVTGLGLARLLAEDGLTRLGRCAAPGCARAFAGGPRNHARRYCSTTCASRARVAAFRARNQQDAGTG
jgi:predicted RNA-binding Zn ribbon-like protein